MLKPFLSALLAAALALGGATACKKKQTAAEARAEKEKAVRADKKQRAIKYYHELAEKFPDQQPWADQAKEKADRLGPPATPAKGGAKPAKK